jgi:hypothetical protein
VTAGEFAFLALGLVLGVAGGAALVEVLRTRPPTPGQVRVTVAPGSIPIRSSTLAMNPFEPGATGPAPFGPADRRHAVRAGTRAQASRLPVTRDDPTEHSGAPVGGSIDLVSDEPRWPAEDRSIRTSVPDDMTPRAPLPAGGGFVPGGSPSPTPGLASTPEPSLVGVAVDRRSNGLFEALLAANARAALVLGSASPGSTTQQPAGDSATPRSRSATLTAIADSPTGRRTLRDRASMVESEPMQDRDPVIASAGGPETGSAATRGRSDAARPDDPCSELRGVAEDRCAVAARAKEGATSARDSLREAQLSYDGHIGRAEAAEGVADPRAVRAAKEQAQAAFREARDAAKDRATLDAAATTWLGAINQINSDARDGAARAAREHSAAQALVTVIERLEVEADAARIGAEAAEEACIAARQAVADCQESAARAAVARASLAPPVLASTAERYPVDEPELLAEAPGDREARILRLLRGDREALLRTVAELAGDDPDEHRRWQLAIVGLVEAITAQAIEASAVDLPDDHPFWGPFTRTQRRDIVSALGSLGYRFDGLGGFADGRVPGQRDLSLAVGYAGLDPMRIRRWPTEAEMPGLMHDTVVAADEYLVEAAGGLSLGELIAMLGRRADALTDLWNDWGRVRPRLLAID